MHKNIFQSFKIVILALVLSIGISYVSAWTAPTVTPPNGNVAAPLNVSSTEQTKNGPVLFNGASNPLRLSSNWFGYTLNGAGGSVNHAEIANDATTYNALMIAGNKSGDGVNRKVKMYDDVEVNQNLSAGSISANSINVTGPIKVGNSLTVCSAVNAGTMRFNAGAFEGCNGTTWETLTVGGGGSCPKVSGSYQFSIAANTTSYNLYNQAQLCGGINLLIAQSFTVTVATGVDVGSFATGSLVSGSSVNIVNNGRIFGTGGNGCGAWCDGFPGGNAITLSSGVTAQIDNTSGYIFGGGGGGAGGRSAAGYPMGGGGGAGYPGGGANGPGPCMGVAGTLLLGGTACNSEPNKGGDSGANGGSAYNYQNGTLQFIGGAAGKAVNPNGGTVSFTGGYNATRVKGLVN